MNRREFDKPTKRKALERSGKLCEAVKRCRKGMPLADRHAHYTDKSGGPAACWLWLGSHNAKGYGIFGVNKSGVLAHRAAYELANGRVPAGLYVLHNCDNRRCVNPAHLRVGTQADNMRDMKERDREVKARGEASGMAKLTAGKVREIRRSTDNRAALARRYNVSWVTIDCVLKGATWAHVK